MSCVCVGGACSCPRIPTPASQVAWSEGLPRLAQGLVQQLVLSPLTSGGHTLLSFLFLLGLSVGPRGKGWVLGPHSSRDFLEAVVHQTCFDTICPSISHTLALSRTLTWSSQEKTFPEGKVAWRGEISMQMEAEVPPTPYTHLSPPYPYPLLSYRLRPTLSAKDPTSKALPW